MPSFDTVCQVDQHEVDNAVQQTAKEVFQRFDFRGTDTRVERTAEGIAIRSTSEGRVEAALKVLQEKSVRRNLSLKSLDAQPVQPAGGSSFRQLVKIREGIDQERAKKIVKTLKDSKLKVQASIQGDAVRVSGKKRDDLQEAIALLKEQDFDLPLSFTNFRD